MALIAWAAASAAALLYLLTSLAAVVGAFVWVGIFPGFWYAVQKALYWPFQPYLDFTLSVMGGPDIPYPLYVFVSRLPFLVLPVVVLVFAYRKTRSRCYGDPARSARPMQPVVDHELR